MLFDIFSDWPYNTFVHRKLSAKEGKTVKKTLIAWIVLAALCLLPVLAAAEGEDAAVLMSFVGDCSLGDSYNVREYTGSYHKVLDEKGYGWPFSLIGDYLKNDDWTVANLEVVLTTRRNHVDKNHPLVGAPDHVNVLTESSVEMVNTVNNHCMDFYVEGYRQTLETLDQAGVQHFGTVYPNRPEGSDILGEVEIKGIRFGFIGFSYPQDSDLKRIAARIAVLKEERGCDLVIVSMHWGRETHMTPESEQAKFARDIINAGADMIWGHHPHVLQPIQVYNGKLILYSTGNFTFGTMSKVDPSTGIFQITAERVDGKAEITELRVIPCQTQGNGDYRPFELTDEKERKAVFKKLTWNKTYYGMENLPASFLETGVVRFENGQMVP